MVSRVIEFAGLTCFGTVALAVESPSGMMQAGSLLALVTFMVAQNYRQGARMAKAIESKDREIKAANARADRLSTQFTDAIVGLTGVLEERPCAMAPKDEPRVIT